MAGVLGKPVGSMSSTSNADEVFENGIYHVEEKAVGSLQNALLVVFKSPLVISTKQFIVQLAYTSSGQLKIRGLWYAGSSDEWRGWADITRSI